METLPERVEKLQFLSNLYFNALIWPLTRLAKESCGLEAGIGEIWWCRIDISQKQELRCLRFLRAHTHTHPTAPQNSSIWPVWCLSARPRCGALICQFQLLSGSENDYSSRPQVTYIYLMSQLTVNVNILIRSHVLFDFFNGVVTSRLKNLQQLLLGQEIEKKCFVVWRKMEEISAADRSHQAPVLGMSVHINSFTGSLCLLFEPYLVGQLVHWSYMCSDPWVSLVSAAPAASGGAVRPFLGSSHPELLPLWRVWVDDSSSGQIDQLIKKTSWLGNVGSHHTIASNPLSQSDIVNNIKNEKKCLLVNQKNLYLQLAPTMQL